MKEKKTHQDEKKIKEKRAHDDSKYVLMSICFKMKWRKEINDFYTFDVLIAAVTSIQHQIFVSNFLSISHFYTSTLLILASN